MNHCGTNYPQTWQFETLIIPVSAGQESGSGVAGGPLGQDQSASTVAFQSSSGAVGSVSKFTPKADGRPQRSDFQADHLGLCRTPHSRVLGFPQGERSKEEEQSMPRMKPHSLL